MTVLVFGRSGQLALSLAEHNAATSHDFRFVGRDRLELSDTPTLERFLDETSFDAIINAAAYTQVDRAEDEAELALAINAEAPAAMARAAERAGAPLIHVSTDYVFDGKLDRPYRESDPVNPTGVYGRSKLAGERAVALNCARHVILRTAWVYSPFGSNFVKTMLGLANRDELGVVDDQLGCPTSALDLTEAIMTILPQVLERSAGEDRFGVFHCAGSGQASWADLASSVFAYLHHLTGQRVPVINRLSTDQYPTKAKRPANTRLDCSLLTACYGVRLPDWHTSVQGCVKRLSELPKDKE